MADNGFVLPCGVQLDGTDVLKSSYEVHEDGSFEALVSNDRLAEMLSELAALIPEPVFFFLELPRDDAAKDGEDHRLFYLDNCTAPVIAALIKEYGSLLTEDGVCRFGFGGNVSGDEIYVKLYKVMSIYCSDDNVRSGTLRIFEKYGLKQTDALITPWELISDDNPAVCVRAEEDGISLFDLPEMLAPAGMYEA